MKRYNKQNPKDEQKGFPTASKVTLKYLYVYDIMSGGKDLKHTRMLQTQLIKMLHAGGFNLRKYSSNCAKLLENVPDITKLPDLNNNIAKSPLEETRKSLIG